LELLGEGDESIATNDEYHKQSTPGLTTVVVPPAPRNQELTMAQQKKARDREYQRRKRAMASRPSTGESDDEVSVASLSSRRPTKRARVVDDD
jgi:chromatin modification-related protein EAF6